MDLKTLRGLFPQLQFYTRADQEIAQMNQALGRNTHIPLDREIPENHCIIENPKTGAQWAIGIPAAYPLAKLLASA